MIIVNLILKLQLWKNYNKKYVRQKLYGKYIDKLFILYIPFIFYINFLSSPKTRWNV